MSHMCGPGDLFIAVAALLVIIQNRGKRKVYREWSNKFYHILTGRTGGKV